MKLLACSASRWRKVLPNELNFSRFLRALQTALHFVAGHKTTKTQSGYQSWFSVCVLLTASVKRTSSFCGCLVTCAWKLLHAKILKDSGERKQTFIKKRRKTPIHSNWGQIYFLSTLTTQLWTWMRRNIYGRAVRTQEMSSFRFTQEMVKLVCCVCVCVCARAYVCAVVYKIA